MCLGSSLSSFISWQIREKEARMTKLRIVVGVLLMIATAACIGGLALSAANAKPPSGPSSPSLLFSGLGGRLGQHGRA
jgi:hypothetical protein